MPIDININASELLNSSLATTAQDAGGAIVKKIIFFSGWIVNWLSSVLPISQNQATALLVIIDLVILLLVLKFVAKPLVKVLIVLALVWFLAGFFFPQ